MKARIWVAVAVGLVGLAIPTSASSAVTIGSDLTLDNTVGVACGVGSTLDDRCTYAQTAPDAGYVSPIDGVIVRWRVKEGSNVAGEVLNLRVLRPVGGGAFVGAGTSAPGVTSGPVVIETFETRLPIQAGDRIGLDAVYGHINVANGEFAGFFSRWFPALSEGGVGTPPGGGFPGALLVNADIEPDTDCDGFGDETQDAAIDPNGCDTSPPETTITGGPKNVVKTKKKRAKVTFAFASSEPGTFECSLDGASFTPCSSPSTHKVKAGRRKPKEHIFHVRAIDAAGNPDSTPATDDFKAKRKKKRK
jgi:hypothetical protein